MCTIAPCATHAKLHRQATDTFFAYHVTSTISTEEVSDHINIATEQASDNMIARIVKALQVVNTGKALALTITIDPNEQSIVMFRG